jgi:hypothetical protein
VPRGGSQVKHGIVAVHSMAVRTDGVLRRCRWLGGAGRRRAARGDGVLGADVGAEAVGPAVAAVPRHLGPARGAGARSGACRRATSCRSAFWCEIISRLPYLTAVFSKKLN